MKKILIVFSLMLTLMFTSIKLNAQTPMTFSLQGGYSWINGVVGAEVQFGHMGLSGGWMPCKMPMSGTKINSMGADLTYYTLTASEEGYSSYISAGIASQGYRYEDSWGTEATQLMTIIMLGEKYQSGGVYFKLGAGYGWCDQAGAFTFEATLGFTLFGN
jgi:hypothetical protein